MTALWERVAYDPRLVGDPGASGRVIMRRVRILTILGVVVANIAGAAVVLCFALWALPTPEEVPDAARWVNAAAAVAYLLFALVVGVIWGVVRIERRESWVVEERAPTPEERDRALRAPLRIMGIQAVLWLGGAAVFTAVNFTYDGLLALGVGITVVIGGLTTSAAAYLLAEFAQRPVAARALAASPPDDRSGAGVTTRWMLVWALGSGILFVAFLTIGIVALTPVSMDETTLAVVMLALSGIGLVFGSLLSLLAALGTSHPIGSIRRGLREVRAGNLDVEVPVWDSTEVGLLQAGFNEMVAGLRERERIRDSSGGRSARTSRARRWTRTSAWAVRRARSRCCSSTSSARRRSPPSVSRRRSSSCSTRSSRTS